MNGITHQQARRYLLLDLDGLLDGDRRLELETHLAACQACRADSEAFSALTPRLRDEFRARWDAHDGPSHKVMANVRSQTRRIIMSNRVNWGLRAVGGVAALVLLGFGMNFLFSQLRERSAAAAVTPSPGNFMPVAAPNAEKRRLAFTLETNGNLDVYTVRADGSDLVNLTGNSNGSNPYWSPDGKRIAFNRNIGSTSQVFLMDADGSNVVQLTDDGDFNKLAAFEEGRDPNFSAWSPDGSKLIFVKLNFEQANDEGWMKLYVLDMETKTQTPLTSEWGLYQSPAWSPDGKRIAFSTFSRFNEQGDPARMSVHVVGADGSDPVDLAAALSGDTFSIFIDWSSDGQAVLFNLYRPADETFQVYETGLDGSLTELSQPIRANLLDWWNGTVLTVTPAEGTVIWQRPDGSSSSLEVCPQASDTIRGASARSKAGVLFFGVRCTRGEWRLYLADEDGRTARELANPPLSTGDGVMADQTWSPDGNFIAFNISSGSNSMFMYIVDVAETIKDPSTQPVQIEIGKVFSSTDGISWEPVITEETLAERPPQPYEGLVAFTSAVENGNLDIYTMRPDGSGLTNLTNDPAHDVDPYWSPDGKRIAFLSDRAGPMQVFVMNADGSDVFQVTSREAGHAFQGLLRSDFSPWSPDGTTLAFLERTPEGGQLLYTMQASGRNGLPLVNEAGEYSSISWSRDGRRIAYIALSENEAPQLHVIDADGGNETIITDALPDGEELYALNYAWTPNGQSLLFIASNLPQGGFSLEGNTPNPYYWKVYEASLDGRTLITHAETRSPIGGWRQGSYFITPFIGVQGWTWVTADGTTSVNPFQNCADSSGGSYLHRQSANGNTFVAARCPNSDWWLYWVNLKGTMVPLLDSPLPSAQGDLQTPAWSPDDKFLAFTVVESGITNLYILNVTQAVGGTPAPPVTVPIGGGDLEYAPSWQPMP